MSDMPQLKGRMIPKQRLASIEIRLLELVNDKNTHSDLCYGIRKYKDGSWAWNTLVKHIAPKFWPATQPYKFTEQPAKAHWATLRVLETLYESVYAEQFTRWSIPPQARYLFEETEEVEIKKLRPNEVRNTITFVKESTDMCDLVKIEKKTFVNDNDVSSMADSTLIGYISKVEKEIKKLEEIGTKSKKIEKKIEDMKQSLTDLAEILDGRE